MPADALKLVCTLQKFFPNKWSVMFAFPIMYILCWTISSCATDSDSIKLKYVTTNRYRCSWRKKCRKVTLVCCTVESFSSLKWSPSKFRLYWKSLTEIQTRMCTGVITKLHIIFKRYRCLIIIFFLLNISDRFTFTIKNVWIAIAYQYGQYI